MFDDGSRDSASLYASLLLPADTAGESTLTAPTAIESVGTTSLVQLDNAYFLYPVGGSAGPQISVMGSPALAGQFGDWAPIGAEQRPAAIRLSGKTAARISIRSGTSTTVVTTSRAAPSSPARARPCSRRRPPSSRTSMAMARRASRRRCSGDDSATFVPVETGGGSGTGKHWSEAVFGNELMSPNMTGASNPLSLLTIAALRDLGYTVDYAQADAYTLPGLAGAGNVA